MNRETAVMIARLMFAFVDFAARQGFSAADGGITSKRALKAKAFAGRSPTVNSSRAFRQFSRQHLTCAVRRQPMQLAFGAIQ
jgi:hypothetical protein